uniref:Uncharacterized protein n=1 Tax=Anguilla anguilla TaxID=7936 RepID=A0A0E9V892_ANGAN
MGPTSGIKSRSVPVVQPFTVMHNCL